MAKRILVVEDEPDIMYISTVRLNHLGYDTIPAADAEAAIAYLKNDSCDLILLDLLLPGMKGEELCKKLKTDDKFKNIPIIIFTANILCSNLSETIKEIGADDCIMKPFEPQELLGKIKKFIG